MTQSTEFQPYASVRKQAYRLELVERWLMIHSSWFLLGAVLIAGLDISTGGWVSTYVPGIFLAWGLIVVLGTDTQYVMSIGMAMDALKDRRRSALLFWVLVLVALALPAMVINSSFGLVDMHLAGTELQALTMLHVGPYWWAIMRGIYGVILLGISKATRPHIERTMAATGPTGDVPTPGTGASKKGSKRAPVRLRPHDSRTGRTRSSQEAMAVWRMDEAKRLLGINTDLSVRQLAAGLTYKDPSTGREFPCHHQTAAAILRKIELETLREKAA